MPGSWELYKASVNRVLIGVLAPPDMRLTMRWMDNATQIQQRAPLGSGLSRMSGLPFGHARNVILKQALDNGFGYCFMLDSVPGETPLFLRDRKTHELDILPIEDLVAFHGEGLERVPTDAWEVYLGKSGPIWTSVEHVIRHPYNGFLRALRTQLGFLTISPNHSIFKHAAGRSSNLVDAAKLEIGDKLAMPALPDYKYSRRTFFLGRQDLAWLYGFFAAEGSVTADCKHIKISNTNEDLLDRARDAFEDYFNRPFHKGQEQKAGSQLIYYLEAHDLTLGRFLRPQFYTSSGHKKVPRSILNAPTAIKLAFLEGESDGDGHIRPGDNFPLGSLTTNSQTLAQGLIFLLHSCGLQYNLFSRPSEDNRQRSYSIFPVKDPTSRHTSDVTKITSVIDVPYTGFIYDVSTESERFVGGVGGFLLHNSDTLPPVDVIPRLLETGRDLIGAYYTQRYPVDGRFKAAAAMMGPQGQRGDLPPFNWGDIIPVHFLPMGATLISRRCMEAVLAKFPRPFEWQIDIDRPAGGLSEDYDYSAKAASVGYIAYLHTGLVAAHETTAHATPGGLVVPGP